MTIKSKTALLSEISVNITDAQNKQNTAFKVREVFNDITDTMFSLGSSSIKKVTVTFQQFKDAIVPGVFPVATAAGAVVSIVKMKHSIAFVSNSADVYLYVNTATGNMQYTNNNLYGHLAVADNVGIDGFKYSSTNTILNHSTGDVFNVIADVSGDTIENLTAGSVDIWYTEIICI